jgi:hypothetical protein
MDGVERISIRHLNEISEGVRFDGRYAGDSASNARISRAAQEDSGQECLAHTDLADGGILLVNEYARS